MSPEPTTVLSADEVESFRRDGFLALDALVPAGEVARLREAYDRLFSTRAGREAGDHFDLAGTDADDEEPVLPQILEPSRYAPELADGLYRANARAVAGQLLGPETSDRGEHAIFKPARTGAATSWHQDEAYWDPRWDHDSLSIWIPLQEATLENGCMQFLPGSHRGGVLPHHPIGGDPRVHGLEVDEVDPAAAVACPLPAGGCTIHHCRTLHYTGANRSDVPRRAYILMFGTPPREHSGERRYPWNETRRTARAERAAAANRAKGAR